MPPPGAHIVGGHCWDKLKFDNSYFKDLLNKTWTLETSKSGKKLYTSGKTMMLPIDMALVEDGKFKEYVQKYANDQAVFFQDFTDAWVRSQELGCGQLRDIL